MKDRIAFISGANKGIGFETARQLGAQGITVVLGSRDATKGRNAADALRAEGIDAQSVQLDVTHAASIDGARDFVARTFGRLDILVNNAGVMRDAFDKAPSEQRIETWHETFDTNLFGAVALTNALLPLIHKSPQGRIVNVSSVLGSMAANVDPTSTFYDFKIPAYNVSKSALNAWTVHLAYELRGTNIRVNAAHPGFVKTDLHGVDAPMTPAQGAETSVRLALLPDSSPTGAFYHGQDALAW